MNISTSTPVVTGAARGLGRHLVDALLERGTPKVYALARDPSKVRADARVVPTAHDFELELAHMIDHCPNLHLRVGRRHRRDRSRP